MRTLFAFSASKHFQKRQAHEALPSTVGRFLKKCSSSNKTFKRTYGCIAKVPRRCMTFDKRAQVDLSGTVRKAEAVLAPSDLFKIQCATNCTERLEETWTMCSAKEQKLLIKSRSKEDVLWRCKAAEIHVKLTGSQSIIPSWPVFSHCAEKGWHDAAMDFYRKQSDEKKMELFLYEWMRALKEKDFHLVRRMNAEKEFTIEFDLFRELVREWRYKGMKRFLKQKEATQVPGDCLVPEIEQFEKKVNMVVSVIKSNK
uniref:Uncharacterized protein n=1 Tax=Steinernema glaseri TaxID=37863 RepID=A0A1I8ASG8_9BILA